MGYMEDLRKRTEVPPATSPPGAMPSGTQNIPETGGEQSPYAGDPNWERWQKMQAGSDAMQEIKGPGGWGGGWGVRMIQRSAADQARQAESDWNRRGRLENQLFDIMGNTLQPLESPYEVTEATSQYDPMLMDAMNQMMMHPDSAQYMQEHPEMMFPWMSNMMGQTPGHEFGGDIGGTEKGYYDQMMGSEFDPYTGTIRGPNAGEFGELGTFEGGVGDVGMKGEAAGMEMEALKAMLVDEGALDPELRAALMAPAEQRSAAIEEKLTNYAMDLAGKNNMLFNAQAISDMVSNIGTAAAEPLVQAESDLVKEGLARRERSRAGAIQGLGGVATREGGFGLTEQGQAMQSQEAHGSFNLEKGSQFLRTQEIREGNTLTARGQDIDSSLKKAGLNLQNYESTEGVNLEKMKYDLMDKWEGQNVDLKRQMELSDEWFKSKDLQLDATTRDSNRMTDMTNALDRARTGDKDSNYQYQSLQVEDFLRKAGIDSNEAMWAGSIIYQLLNGREDRDQQMEMFLKELESKTQGGGFGGFLGGLIGGAASIFTGGASSYLTDMLFGGGGGGGGASYGSGSISPRREV